MRLAVFSHKPCWPAADSPTGYATDGGFPFQMEALSQLFDSTRLVVPCAVTSSRTGEMPLNGHNLSVAPLTEPGGRGLKRKLLLPFWLLRNTPTIIRELLKADGIHAPIPGDIGTIGMVLAVVLRKPLFVRHCGNWLKPVTKAEHFWKWFMQKFAGGRKVMLATGGSTEPPSRIAPAIKWIFSTTMTEAELRSCASARPATIQNGNRLIIVCRQDREKGTGRVIESLPEILKALPGAMLDVVGDGPSLAEFRELADTLGIADRVVFHGKLDHEAVVALLKQADLFCYPTSASEGFPKVVLEALACGVPVVTTNVSVLPELMSSGGGLLLDEVTSDAIAAAVVSILSDPNRRADMSARAVKTAARFSLEKWREAIGAELLASWGPLRSQELNSKNRKTFEAPKVCFVVGTLGRGGAERQLLYMLKALKAEGINANVLCLTRGEALEQEILDLGIPVTWVGKSRWRWIRLLRIIRELRRSPANILQSTHFYTNLYVAVAGRMLGVKSIGAIRNNLTSEIECSGVMAHGQLRGPAHLIANSQLARERAIAKGIKSARIFFVPNAVEVNGDRANGRANANGAIRILFAGRLTEQKRPDRFLHLLRNLAKREPQLNFKATIVGDGPLRQNVEHLADKLDLKERVALLGEVRNVRPFYLESDLLVLTSDFEGTPNVLLEAMAHGLPIVATKVGGIPDIIGGDRGVIVDPNNEEALTAAALEVIANAKLRKTLSDQGRQYVADCHSLHMLQGRLTEIYRSVLAS